MALQYANDVYDGLHLSGLISW